MSSTTYVFSVIYLLTHSVVNQQKESSFEFSRKKFKLTIISKYLKFYQEYCPFLEFNRFQERNRTFQQAQETSQVQEIISLEILHQNSRLLLSVFHHRKAERKGENTTKNITEIMCDSKSTLNLLLVALLLNLWGYLATLQMSCQNYVEIVANSAILLLNALELFDEAQPHWL